MSTTVYINSLVRYKEDTCAQPEPNPFEFTVPASITSKWRYKKIPHSVKATRDPGGFEARLDAITIPAYLMPDPEPVVMYEVNGRSNLDIGNMTRVKCNNQLCQEIIDTSNCGCVPEIAYQVDDYGCTGSCIVYTGCTGLGCTGVTGATVYARCENSKKANLNNTWVAHFDRTGYASDSTPLFHVYKSNNVVSIRDDAWYGCDLQVKVLDSCGVVLTPPSTIDLCQVCDYARLFCKENQVLAIFRYDFEGVQSTFGPACFATDK